MTSPAVMTRVIHEFNKAVNIILQSRDTHSQRGLINEVMAEGTLSGKFTKNRAAHFSLRFDVDGGINLTYANVSRYMDTWGYKCPRGI